MSEIRKFYHGQNVFITGGTGFMGKILMEKLLRSTDVATIFLLIREKKGKNAQTRLDDLLGGIIFEKLKTVNPKFKDRVVAIPGDCSYPGLGLGIDDRQKLTSEVNIAFHVAATVRFNENLKLAYSINVTGTADVIELCQQMKNLKALIHVSTAFSNCHLDSIEESFYDYPVDYEQLGAALEDVSELEADKILSEVIGNWPNTYTFTKALAEALIKDRADSLPIGIFRPSIVLSTSKEPIRGWTNNLHGPTAAVAGAASGLLRVFPCKVDLVVDIVPVDTCIAGIIASAWDVANKPTPRISSNTPIYNYVSSVENPVTWRDYYTSCTTELVKYPHQNAIWTVKIAPISYRKLYLLLRIVLHLIPAVIVDTVATIAGQKTKFLWLYSRIHKHFDVTVLFLTKQWTFTNHNVVNLWEKMNQTDRILFPLSMSTVQWTTYFHSYVVGVRIYLLKDPMCTLEGARARKRKFDVLHHLVEFVLGVLAIAVVINVVTFFTGSRWFDC